MKNRGLSVSTGSSTRARMADAAASPKTVAGSTSQPTRSSATVSSRTARNRRGLRRSIIKKRKENRHPALLSCPTLSHRLRENPEAALRNKAISIRNLAPSWGSEVRGYHHSPNRVPRLGEFRNLHLLHPEGQVAPEGIFPPKQSRKYLNKMTRRIHRSHLRSQPTKRTSFFEAMAIVESTQGTPRILATRLTQDLKRRRPAQMRPPPVPRSTRKSLTLFGRSEDGCSHEDLASDSCRDATIDTHSSSAMEVVEMDVLDDLFIFKLIVTPCNDVSHLLTTSHWHITRDIIFHFFKTSSRTISSGVFLLPFTLHQGFSFVCFSFCNAGACFIKQ